MKAPLAVTLSGNPTPELEVAARSAAMRWGVPFSTRARKQPLSALLSSAGALLVFSRDAVTLVDPEGSLAFHEGMAHLRLQRLDSGEGDTLVKVAGVTPGETVLDCTLGLAHDALVLARAVGPGGRVIGLEKSLPLFALVEEGLRRHLWHPASGRIELVHADAAEYLRSQPDKSVDLVFFDPMFSRPKKSQGGFDVLRRYAEHAPLSRELIEEARRVASRAVVVKAGAGSRDLTELGLTRAPTSRHSDLSFAIVAARP